MSLPSLLLREVYDSEDSDIIRDLQVPLLRCSTSYTRGVGFFTSGWLRLAAEGMERLVANGGTANIVVSPILEPSDWEAMQLGEAAKRDALLLRILQKDVDRLSVELHRDTLEVLAWLVAQDLLQFRFAIPRHEPLSDYHDKVAVFRDAVGNRVAIHGSFNDSVKATLNGEAFSVFKSWVEGQVPFVTMHEGRLARLWHGTNKQFFTHVLPDAIKQQFIRLRKAATAPYTSQPRSLTTHIAPSAPLLREYQQEAIGAWFRSGCRGMFEMATGTGKTFTALAAAEKCFELNGALAVVVAVPYLHLVDQWSAEAKKFGFSSILCSGDDQSWPHRVREHVQNLRLGIAGRALIIAVHKTASSSRFRDALLKARNAQMLLIADEAHGLGAKDLRSALLKEYTMRLGLSATPRRWFDDAGSEALEQYFSGVCYELPLGQAIGKFLVPYSYHPHLVHLSESERREWSELTRQLGSLSRSVSDADEIRKRLLLKRARIISQAEAKLPALMHLIREQIQAEGLQNLGSVLIYTAPGCHREALVSVAALGIRCHEFVHYVDNQRRKQVLEQFAKGDIQALIAVKCLDEGVDVPSTRTAYFMASSTNPREFVQRRGRILRKAAGKQSAVIHDFVVVPPLPPTDADTAVLRREMPRFAEFAELATNEFSSRAVVRPILDATEMLPLLDKKPWDVYHELREEDWTLSDDN